MGIISEELMASMDEPTECMVMHRTKPSRLQALSLQLSDKLAQLVENNERLLELRPGGWQGQWRNKDGNDRRDGKKFDGKFSEIVETEIMSVVASETMIEMIEITSLEIGTMTEIMIEATGITEVVFLVTNLATILTAIQEENFKTRTLTISFVTLFLSKIASSCLEIFHFFVKPSSSRESKILQSDLG